MSQISNKFFITAIEDGTTLHGNLSSTKPLQQGWNGSAAVPSWSVATNQPTIYLTLLSGSTAVQPTEDVVWKYDGTTITFNSSTGISTNFSGLFRKTTYSVGGIEMPALLIRGNIANGSGGVDVHTITFEGAFSASGGSEITFSATTQIRITAIVASGYFGLIDFVDGISNFTERGQSIKLYGRLYSGSGDSEIAITQYNGIRWYVNEQLMSSSETYTDSQGVTHYALALNESNVTDNAIVRAEFYSGSNTLFSTLTEVDDLTDPQYLYIQYNGANGRSATLRTGEKVDFYFWVARTDNHTSHDAYYNTYKIRLLDSSGVTIMDSGLGDSTTGYIPDPDSNGWRTCNYGYNSDYGFDVANCPFNYTTVNTYGKNMTAIVLATHTD